MKRPGQRDGKPASCLQLRWAGEIAWARGSVSMAIIHPRRRPNRSVGISGRQFTTRWAGEHLLTANPQSSEPGCHPIPSRRYGPN